MQSDLAGLVDIPGAAQRGSDPLAGKREKGAQVGEGLQHRE